MPTHPAPDAPHTTIPLPVPLAANWIVPCGLIVEFAGVMVSVGVPAIVTVAPPDTAGSATEVATTVTFPEEGTEAGAVYSPVLETVPHEPLHPDRLQLTAVFVVPVTVAANCCWLPTLTVADDGDTVTVTAVAA
jgi:hypothetical protein